MAVSLDLLNHLVLFTIKATLLLMMVGALVELGRGLAASSARSLLALATAAVAVMPLVSATVPTIPVAFVPESIAHWLHVPLVTVTDQKLIYNSLMLALLGVYLLVACWLICHLLLGIVQVVKLSRAAIPASDTTKSLMQGLVKPMQLRRGVRVLTTTQVTVPQTWGWRAPVVLLPEAAEKWPQARLRRVLAHELAHIKRCDWLIQILLHLVTSLLWFVPSVWATARRSAWYAELACDDWVVALDGGRAEYADDLLRLTVTDHTPSLAVVALGRESALFTRIRSVLDGARNRAPAKPAEWLLFYSIGLLLLVPLASVQAVVHESGHSLFVHQRVQVPLTLAPTVDLLDEPKGVALPRTLAALQLGVLKQTPALPPAHHEEVVVRHWREPQPEASALIAAPNMTFTANTPHIAMQGPIPLVSVTPAYPRRALLLGLEGTVTVAFDIELDGRVDNLRLVEAKPDSELLSRAVTEAVQQFRFRPPQIDGIAMKTENVTETFVFQLRDDSTAEE